MKNKFIYIFAFILFAAGIGWLAYTGFTQNSVYFLNVAEAKGVDPVQLQKVRLFGVVAPQSIDGSLGNLKFRLADKDIPDLIIPVSYNGVIPDNFKHGAEVIVEGGLQENGTFAASLLMTKCPSKYKKENREKKSV